MSAERFIVAELSKNWPEDQADLECWNFGQPNNNGLRRFLAQRFEDVLNHNAARGYKLVDWKFDRSWSRNGLLNETIIAIFELVE
jgi:hypothetical protein